jgi:hypothetical protein
MESDNRLENIPSVTVCVNYRQFLGSLHDKQLKVTSFLGFIYKAPLHIGIW